MKRKLLIVVGVALAAATASTVIFYKLISGSMGGNAGHRADYSVVTAARALPRGTRLSEADLKVTAWGGEALPAGVHTQPGELAGRLVQRDVQQGEPIFDSGLSAAGKGGKAAAIPAGMRAVSIHLAEYAGVAKLLEDGDRVDVLAADSERRPGNLEATLHTVLQGVEVLDAGKDDEPSNRHGPPVVTVLVEAKDSEALNLADQAGAIRLALRNPLDSTTEESSGTAWRDVVRKRNRTAARDSAVTPSVREISAVRRPAKSQRARDEQHPSDVAAVMPDLNARRPDPKPVKDEKTSETGKVLLAVTFAGLGDEALAELSTGLADRYTNTPLILSAFRPNWDVQKRVQALREKQSLEVFAEPNILALAQTEAHFERTSDSAEAAVGTAATPSTATCPDRVGVRVSFLPRIREGNSLRIRVTSEVAVPDSSRPAAAGDCGPSRVAMRQWSGEIELADGQSFWVRGLIDRPGAWDLLRRLFPRQPLQFDRNDELAILVTPRLVAVDRRDQPLSAVLPH